MSVPHPRQELWQAFIETVKKSIPRESYHTWFSPMKFIRHDDSEITVQVPSQFYYEWIEEHYKEIISAALLKIYGNSHKLCYSILEKDTSELLKLGPSKNPVITPKTAGSDSTSFLNPRYTFKNFIEGDCNSFAKAASLAAAEAPGRTKFNPLVIYGGVGLGKTHLVQAIGNFAVSNGTAQKALYVSSEKFTTDFITSVKQNKTTDFSRLYRLTDILLVDDVQFFNGKERTQMEFFHTFNSLYQSGKQIILSMDCPPSELTDIESRLLSRFQWGLVTDIQPPDFETRIAILQKRAEDDSLFLGQDVLEFVAAYVTNNVRELEGSLIRLMAFASITGQDIDLKLAQRLLKDIVSSKPLKISVEQIQETVADWSNLPSDLIRGNSRKKEIVKARHIAIYLSDQLTDLTLKSIGSHFGNRDHSTIIHAIRTLEDKIKSDNEYKKEVDSIRAKVEK